MWLGVFLKILITLLTDIMSEMIAILFFVPQTWKIIPGRVICTTQFSFASPPLNSVVFCLESGRWRCFNCSRLIGIRLMVMIYRFWSSMIEHSVFCWRWTLMYSNISLCSATILNVLLSCFIMYENSLFAPQSTSLTKHVIMPIALCSLAKMNIPLLSVAGKDPSLMSSSFNFKYQNLLASARPYRHFCSFCTWLVLASFGGLTYTVRYIALPCKNADLTSNKFNVHLFDAIIEQVRQKPCLEHVGLSVLKFCSSLKPLAHNLALINFSLSTNFSLITHLREIQL